LRLALPGRAGELSAGDLLQPHRGGLPHQAGVVSGHGDDGVGDFGKQVADREGRLRLGGIHLLLGADATQGAKRVLRLHHEVARDNFRLLVDTGTFYPVEFDNTLNAIAQCAPFAGMAHVKDHLIRTSPPASLENWRERGRGIYTQATIAGDGSIGLAAAVRSLHAAGYDGYLSLEYEGPDEARYANSKGLDNLRSALRGLEPDSGPAAREN
jgi:sugar phosphate isomerase/epimerase